VQQKTQKTACHWRSGGGCGEMNKDEPFDICHNRHRGNAESVAINPTVSIKQQDRTRVFEIIKNSRGVTSKEIAKQMGRRLNCISGRISELKRAKLVTVRGRRDDCGVVYEN
jgi:hypothetical protein